MANNPLIVSGGALTETTQPRVAKLLDVNGNVILSGNAITSAVNYLEVENGPSTTGPTLWCRGTASNLSMWLATKGTGKVNLWDADADGTAQLGADGSGSNVTMLLTGKGTSGVTARQFSVQDPTDTTKLGKFDASAITTGTTRTYSLPDAAGPMVVAAIMIRQHAAYTLTSTTSVQQLFNGSTNGTITLAVGTYRFGCLASLSSMSATSGNGAFSLAGTATLGSVLMYAQGRDGSVNTVATLDGTLNNTAAFPNPMHTGQTATALQTLITGTFEVTVAGTVIPSFALNTAAAAVVAAGSYFECWHLGATTTTAIGAWT